MWITALQVQAGHRYLTEQGKQLEVAVSDVVGRHGARFPKRDGKGNVLCFAVVGGDADRSGFIPIPLITKLNDGLTTEESPEVLIEPKVRKTNQGRKKLSKSNWRGWARYNKDVMEKIFRLLWSIEAHVVPTANYFAADFRGRTLLRIYRNGDLGFFTPIQAPGSFKVEQFQPSKSVMVYKLIFRNTAKEKFGVLYDFLEGYLQSRMAELIRDEARFLK
jgi:hypothetical protein